MVAAARLRGHAVLLQLDLAEGASGPPAPLSRLGLLVNAHAVPGLAERGGRHCCAFNSFYV